MNFESLLLNNLKAAQQQFSLDALKRPHDKTEFEYGFRTGVVQGYEFAIDILLHLLDEEQNGNNDI